MVSIAGIGNSHSQFEHGEAARDWFSPARFALILGGFILVCFSSVLVGAQSFYIRDFGYFGYPLASYYRDCFWRGELPLWNPLSSNGLPFLAQWNTLVLYPGSLIYLLLPLPWSLNVFCLAHFFLAGLGAYVLARRWTQDGLAASVAGVAFAFNGLTLNCLMWPNNIAALGWMPWVVLLTERACRAGGRTLIPAALVGATQMLSGAPEFIMVTWGFTAVLVIGQSVRQEDRWRFDGRLLLRLVVIVGLISGLAAAQLLPFLDLLKYSHRDQTTADAIAWPMPLWGWANFLVPRFRSFRTAVGVFFQPGQDWTTSYYPGIGVVALALLAVVRVRKLRVWLLAAMFALSLILALGNQGYLYGWIRRAVPQLGVIRFAIKFVVLAIFCIPLLASFAVRQQNCSDDAAVGRTSRRWAGLLVATLLLAIGAIVWWSYHHPLQGEPYSASWWHGLGGAAFLVAILGMALNGHRWKPHRAPWLPGLTLLLLIWLDVWTQTRTQNPTLKPGAFVPSLAREHWKTAALTPEPAPGSFRAWTPRYAYEPMLNTMIPDPGQDFLVHRLGLFANCNLLENVPIVGGFFSIYLQEQRDIWSILYFASSTTNASHLLDLVGVAALPSPTNIFQWESRPGALPFASIGQQPRFADSEGTLTALTRPDYSPQQFVYLPTNAFGVITATNQPSAQILTQTFSAHHIELESTSAGPAIVHLSQSFYHPWKVYIDGQPAIIWRANHAFQAVEVPAGRHRLRFIYEDRWFRLGAMVSFASVLICAALSWRWRERRA